MKTDTIYEAITEKFIAQLKAGTIPWQKPWSGAMNIVSGKQYRGINAMLLGGSEFSSPYWMSFKQALELGGNIRKGSKGSMVVFYKLLAKTDQAGNPVYDDKGREKHIPLLRYSHVFNFEQTENVPLPPPIELAPMETIAIDEATRIADTANICPIIHEGTQASYSPSNDCVRIPASQSFRSPQDYYHTLFHELTHATGHETRLAREGVMSKAIRFGSETYSKEELIAEIGASFISNTAGILTDVTFQNAASYLNSWIAALANDHRLIVTAASQAQRAADLILGNKTSLQE